LKKSEQKIYTLARMASAEELLGTFVFSEHHEFVVPIIQSGRLGAAAYADKESSPAKGAILPRESKESTAYASSWRSDQSLTSAEDVVLDVKARNPAVGQAKVLSMDAAGEQERVENVSEDVHALVGRLQNRNHILSNLSCVCCADEQHGGSKASAQADLQPLV
jgi:hypothetical protein